MMFTIQNILLSFIIFILLPTVSIADSIFEEESDFLPINPLNTRIVKGDLSILGNSVMCYKIHGRCQNDTPYRYYYPWGKKTNAEVYMRYIDIDSDGSTFNSSASTLHLPPNSKVLWASIFWEGYLHDATIPFHIEDDDDVDTVLSRPIKIKSPNSSSYIPIIAQKVYRIDRSDDSGYDVAFTYAAFSDITDLVKSGGNGDYIVANVPCLEGKTWDDGDGLGNFGAWAITIIYQDPNGLLKNVTIFAGYKSVTEDDIDIFVNGFYTPPTGPVHATLYNFVAEGDRYIYGDQFLLNNNRLYEKNLNDNNNYFNSSISETIYRTPSIMNNNGIDIHEIEVGQDDNTSHPQIIGNSTTSAQITFRTDGDHYFPAMVAFSVELYVPKICYFETLYDKNGNELNETSVVTVGDQLTTKITIRNDDYEIAHDVYIIRSFESNTTEYIPNSTSIKDLGYQSFIHVDDNQSLPSDNLEVRISTAPIGPEVNETNLTVGPFGIDDEQNAFPPWSDPDYYAYQKEANITYSFKPKKSGVLSNIYKTSYYYKIFDYVGTIEGTKLPKCIEFNNTIPIYEPNTEIINLVNTNFTGDYISTDPNDPQNALYTQVINKPFNILALFLKRPPNPNEENVPLERSHTLTTISVVDACESSDCTNAPSLNILQKKILVYFDNSKSKQAEVNITKLSKGVRFKATYFKWIDLMATNSINCANPKLYSSKFKGMPLCMTDHSDTSLDVSTLQKIFGQNNPCFTQDLGNPCSSSGVGSLSPYNQNDGTDCLHCLLDHSDLVSYSWSMDTFAIRPDRFQFELSHSMPIVAQHEINITFKALDPSGTYVQDYNETNGTSFKLDIVVADSTKSCQHPSIEINNSIHFVDGYNSNYYTFSDIGEFNMSIHEINGSEFAKIDANDTNDSQRLITPYKTTIKIIPHHFEIDTTLKNMQNKNFTYISNILQSQNPSIAAVLDLNITAKGEQNGTMKNYTSSCYAKEHAVAFDYNTSLGTQLSNVLHNILFYEEATHISGISPIEDGNFTIDFNNSIFTPSDHNGTAKLRLFVNFDRNVSLPAKPFDLNVTTIGTKDSDDVNGSGKPDTLATYYYARLHAPVFKTKENNITTKLFFEVYDPDKADPAGIEGAMSEDDIDWYRNTAHDSTVYGRIDQLLHNGHDLLTSGDSDLEATLGPLNSGVRLLTLKYKKSRYPYSAKIDLNASSWLIYNRYDPNATTNTLEVIFEGKGNWKGIGTFKTQDEINQSKVPYNRIQW